MINSLRVRISIAGLILALLGGCRQGYDITFEPDARWQSLPPGLQKAAAELLTTHCGTFAEPKLLSRDDVALTHLKHGQAVYQERCSQCHGDSGDGDGPVAAHMYPRPRDYRKGTFKFTSTDYGAKPLREDLVRTVQRGIRGTSMPSFELIPKDDLEAVVDYVLYLTHRGELEERLLQIAEVEEALDPEIVQSDGIDLILDKWKSARASVIVPKSVEPEFTAEHVRRGKERFLSNSTGCLKCHGEDGRGRTPDNLAGNLKDTWGRSTRAADLTSGMLHGGQESLDIYRRIYGGINGTPMPGFANAFRDEPDAIWELVAYVKYVTNRRRIGEASPPGVIKPYVPAETVQPDLPAEAPAGD